MHGPWSSKSSGLHLRHCRKCLAPLSNRHFTWQSRWALRHCNCIPDVQINRTMTTLARHLRSRWLPYNAPIYTCQPGLYAPSLHHLRRELHGFHRTPQLREKAESPSSDPKINDLERAIEDDFATIREKYGAHTLNPHHSQMDVSDRGRP